MVASRGLIFTVFGMLSALIVWRLFYLQILTHSKWREKSREVRTRVIKIPPERGLILTADGKVVATSTSSWDLFIVPAEVKDETLLDEFFNETGIEPVDVEGKFASVAVAYDLDFDAFSKVSYVLHKFPFLRLEAIPKRWYPEGKFAAHILGYVGMGKGVEHIGRAGVEKTYNEYLKGEPSGKIVEFDAHGRVVRIIEEVKGLEGKTITLTIDSNLQKLAESLLDGKEGAIVVMNSNTGEVLAMVSKPDFNPNDFARFVEEEVWKRYSENPKNPLLARAIAGTYHPGSLFKIIVAIAGLEEGLITPQTKFMCQGKFVLGGVEHRCWNEHGMIDLKEAIVHSCDVYFYKLGLKLGADIMARWARKLGLGEKTGIDLPEEAHGIVPDTKWKLLTFGEKWYKGEDILYAVGQSFLTVTPIEIARAFAAIGGFLVKPHVVKSIDGVKITTEAQNDKLISEQTRSFILSAMQEVVERGTGWRAKVSGLEIGGKTGTAQVVSVKTIEKKVGKPIEEIKPEEIPYNLRDHSWFVALVPANNPEFVVVVLVEHGGFGGKVAAPIARKILERLKE